MEDMKRRLTDAIKSCNDVCIECDKKTCEDCFLLNEYEKEAAALIRAGALMPPVKIGDTVYAVVELDDGPEVAEYIVAGFEYKRGKWYAVEKGFVEGFEVGGQLCLLTREEAEAVLEKMRRARDGDQ